MTNELQTFTYNNSQVRTIEQNGEPWFVGKDVADILGYSNTKDALANHVDDDDRKVLQRSENTTFDIPNRGLTIINESGLYSLILGSKLPSARQFKRWVTSEVLPSIRKTGAYSAKAGKPSKALEIKEMNARVRLSNQFLKLSKVETLSPDYKNILAAKAAEVLTGEEIIPPPKSPQKMYTASEIGAMLGVSAQKIGRLSNQHNLKTAEYGEWYHDKSRYSSKEVDSFRYNDKAVEKFKKILG